MRKKYGKGKTLDRNILKLFPCILGIGFPEKHEISDLFERNFPFLLYSPNDVWVSREKRGKLTIIMSPSLRPSEI